jgi:cytochrome c peroxidase
MAERYASYHPGVLATLLAMSMVVSTASIADPPTTLDSMERVPNPSGFATTFSMTGSIDLQGPFFQSLGTNGRSCATCHDPSDGWTISPSHVRARFDASAGTDPIFRINDGSVSPNADVSTLEARRTAYAMLLNKGLIRVGIPIPAGAEFQLIGVDDPYGYASASELSLFRRPLPSTNLNDLSTVMWDGRETFLDSGSRDCILGTTSCFSTIQFDLSDQADAAATGHAQGGHLTTSQRESIVAFETALFTAQVYDNAAGELGTLGVRGGPLYLVKQLFYFGINDLVSGDYRGITAFNPAVFNLYDGWNTTNPGGGDQALSDARRAVARGQTLFNSKPITITGVKGLNDDFNVPALQGTCSTCHDAPNVGGHSIPAPLDIGLTDASRRTADMPLYTLRNLADPRLTIQTTDPGRALITGKWKDIGRFKGPVLRALASRAPYFHNGFAADLGAVIDFYDTRFDIRFTEQEKADLLAFLATL